MIFEAIQNKPFNIITLTDMYMYMYACMLASNEFKDEYEKFIEIVDENPGIVEEFNKLMKEHYENDKAMYGTDKAKRAEDGKKKE
jgi:hypothetical protein